MPGGGPAAGAGGAAPATPAPIAGRALLVALVLASNGWVLARGHALADRFREMDRGLGVDWDRPAGQVSSAPDDGRLEGDYPAFVYVILGLYMVRRDALLAVPVGCLALLCLARPAPVRIPAAAVGLAAAPILWLAIGVSFGLWHMGLIRLVERNTPGMEGASPPDPTLGEVLRAGWCPKEWLESREAVRVGEEAR